MKRFFAFGGALAFALGLGNVVGCSEDKPAELTSGGGGDAGADAGGLALGDPAVPCADADDAVYADPGPIGAVSDADRGAIMKCAKGAELSADGIQSELARTGYKGKPVTSGARVYKVSYKTRRGDASSKGGYSSALVYVPTVPRAAGLPIVVSGRGSRGQAERCAVSKLDPSLPGINDDALRNNLSLVGAGYAVIVPDLPGYAKPFGTADNPPSAYAQAGDVGQATLDGSRALKRLYPGLADKTVLVGHSQGGHSVLAALAKSETYGAQGSIVAVAAYAPLWLSQRTWGALLDEQTVKNYKYKLTDPAYTTASAVSVWYHYTQAELLDGPGEGEKLFDEAHRAAVKKFVEEACWGETQALLDTGVEYVYSLFTPAFRNAVGFAATGLSSCDASDAVCNKWLGRYAGDRPHLTGAAKTTPLLVLYGGKDTTIPPSRFSCAADRLNTDGAAMTFCYEAEATHQSILDMRSEYVADWIASIALGAPAPAPCAVATTTAIGETCASPPPND